MYKCSGGSGIVAPDPSLFEDRFFDYLAINANMAFSFYLDIIYYMSSITSHGWYFYIYYIVYI